MKRAPVEGFLQRTQLCQRNMCQDGERYWDCR